jgi:hypothetical protein
MKALRRALVVICLGATLGWAALTIVKVWIPDSNGTMTQWTMTFAIVTLAAVVGLGALHYARGTD